MPLLKADFHTHTSDDPRDEISYSAESLIDAVAEKGVQVLAITCHDWFAYGTYLAEYARRRGILLIPGIESHIEDRHVVILNPDSEQLRARTFAQLRELGPRDAAIIAPHPYFPGGSSLMETLVPNIDLFHAIEFSSFYFFGINFNHRASRVARQFGLPIVGNSDTHVLPYEDSTFTWIDSEPNVESIIDAIRNGRVRLETRPRPLPAVVNMLKFAAGQAWRDYRKPTLAEGHVQ